MVEVQKIFPSGRIVTVTSRGSFDLLADAAMFAETHYYPATISTCKISKIFLLPKTELLKLFSLDQAVMLNFLCSVSNRIFVLNRKIELLSLNSIQTKIAHFLISESESRGSDSIQLPFSKKSWAEHINVSRTSLSRELRQLEREGLIAFDKRSIKIQDIEKLKRILL
jgi:CRP-like cAMP-binding protein